MTYWWATNLQGQGRDVRWKTIDAARLGESRFGSIHRRVPVSLLSPGAEARNLRKLSRFIPHPACRSLRFVNAALRSLAAISSYCVWFSLFFGLPFRLWVRLRFLLWIRSWLWFCVSSNTISPNVSAARRVAASEVDLSAPRGGQTRHSTRSLLQPFCSRFALQYRSRQLSPVFGSSQVEDLIEFVGIHRNP